MKDYIRRNGLVLLGLFAFSFGAVLQLCTGMIDGSVLFPLPLIYAALCLRERGEKA